MSQKRSPGLFKLLDDAGDLWSLSRGRKEGIGGWGLRGLGFRLLGSFGFRDWGVGSRVKSLRDSCCAMINWHDCHVAARFQHGPTLPGTSETPRLHPRDVPETKFALMPNCCEEPVRSSLFSSWGFHPPVMRNRIMQHGRLTYEYQWPSPQQYF